MSEDCIDARLIPSLSLRKIGNPLVNSGHLWASAFLVFGFKSEPPLVQLKAIDMVLVIKKTALPLAIRAFTAFSRCNSALELLKVCINVLEEVEKSFVSQIQDWCHGSLCWKKKLQSNQRVDEYVWQDVTLLKATLLETRAKLLLRGGHVQGSVEYLRISSCWRHTIYRVSDREKEITKKNSGYEDTNKRYSMGKNGWKNKARCRGKRKPLVFEHWNGPSSYSPY